jgi:hypothetical protein
MTTALAAVVRGVGDERVRDSSYGAARFRSEESKQQWKIVGERAGGLGRCWSLSTGAGCLDAVGQMVARRRRLLNHDLAHQERAVGSHAGMPEPAAMAVAEKLRQNRRIVLVINPSIALRWALAISPPTP